MYRAEDDCWRQIEDEDESEKKRGHPSIQIVRRAPQAGATDRQRKVNAQQKANLQGPATPRSTVVMGSKDSSGKEIDFWKKNRDAYEYCIGRMKEKVRVVKHAMDTESLLPVVEFVQKNNSKIGMEGRSFVGDPLPVGLLVLGGISSRDHAKSFETLCCMLKEKRCFSASIHGCTLVKSKVWNAHSEVVNNAINSIFRQVSGIDCGADDSLALISWHCESGEGKTIVVIVEELEAADSDVLRDFVSILSDAGSEIPVTLLIGMSSVGTNLHDILPGDVVSRTIIRRFETKSSMQQRENFIEKVFMDPNSMLSLTFCPQTISYLDEHFLRRDMSLDVFERSFCFACVDHFYNAPLSFIAPFFGYVQKDESVDGVHEECNFQAGERLEAELASLSNNDVQELAGLLGVAVQSKRHQRHEIARIITSTVQSRREWILALHLLHLSAAKLGCAGAGSGLSLRELHRDASDPRFFSKGPDEDDFPSGLRLLGKIKGKIEDSSRESVMRLASEIKEFLERSCSGLFADVLLKLQQIISSLEESADNMDGNIVSNKTELPVIKQVPEKEMQPHTVEVEHWSSGETRRMSASQRKGILAARVQALSAAGQEQTSITGIRKDITRGIGADLGDLLHDIVLKYASTCPAGMPGSELFCLKAAASIKQCLLEPSPREAIEGVLQNPLKYASLETSLSTTTGNDRKYDPSLAYRAMQKFDRVVEMQQWYHAFTELIDGALKGSPDPQEGTRKKRDRTSHLSGPRISGKLTEQLRLRKSRSSKKRETVDWESREPSIVRFLEAAFELQACGILRPCKRKRGDFVERWMHGGVSTESCDSETEADGMT